MSDPTSSVPHSDASRDDAQHTRLIYGAMPLGGSWEASEALTDEQQDRAFTALDAAAEAGYRDLDLADIYAAGKSETVVGRWLRERPELRGQMRVQTKAGIRMPGSTAPHDAPMHCRLDPRTLRESLEGSLERLGLERVDTFFIHRWDPLADIAALGAELDALRSEGLTRDIAVSNLSWDRMELLQEHMDSPLTAVQLQLSLDHRDFVERQVLRNHPEGRDVDFDEVLLDRCAQHGIEIQAWGSMAQGIFTGAPAPDSTDEPRNLEPTIDLVRQLAQGLGCSREAVVLAWLLRLPQRIRPVIGTTSPERIRACVQADAAAAQMTYEQWYALWTAARGHSLP